MFTEQMAILATVSTLHYHVYLACRNPTLRQKVLRSSDSGSFDILSNSYESKRLSHLKKKKKTEREEGVYPFSVFPRAQEPTLTCQLSIPAVQPARGARYLTKSRKITSPANYRFPLINV